MIRALFLLLIVSFSGCINEVGDSRRDNAKWFCYSYLLEQNVYTKDGREISPLICELQSKGVDRLGPDTTKYFFSLYTGDTLNECFAKPYGLFGVVSVKDSLYTPIYHYVIFEPEGNSVVAPKMNALSDSLFHKVTENGVKVSSWLYKQAILRQKQKQKML